MKITFKEVCKQYPNGYLALDRVNFELASGEFAFLTGHSGAGKSTLLKLIAGIELANQGQIQVGHFNLHSIKSRQIPFLRRQIGIILQTPHLLMDRPVFDNIALPMVIANASYREIQSRVRAILSKVGLSKKENFYPYELSIGEQQRVSIARAIINKPSLLLADEPTGNLDPDLSAEIMCLFQQFNQLGMSVLIASHDLALIQQLNYRKLVLHQGTICNDG